MIGTGGTRSAEPGDRAAAKRLIAAAGLPLEGVDEAFADFLVAEREGRIVGVVGAERHGNVALLRSAAVAEEARGGGVGRELVELLLARCAEGGLREVYLLTTTAERYFERLGFTAVPRASLPPELAASPELRGVCPASATAMMLELDGRSR
jgi:amino-acid N-acetyltransferase